MAVTEDRFKGFLIKEDDKEIGFVSNENYWGKGYMTEALNALINYTFEELNTKNIYMCNAIENVGSSKVQEKCGFKQIGIEPNSSSWIDGTMVDTVQRRMTIKDYATRNTK